MERDGKKIPVIIDCDTGIDDALALTMACASPKLDIKAITVVAGNVELAYTLPNTLNVLKLLGREDIPVAGGADKPLNRELLTAGNVHGTNGLRGYRFSEEAKWALKAEPAWELMRDILLKSPEKVTILAIAPLTNIALLLDKYQEVKNKIEKIVFMGGSVRTGNPTPLSTFNVLVDPEAYRKVIFSGVPFYAVPLDTTREAYLTEEDVKEIKEMEGPVAAMAAGVLAGYGVAAVDEESLKKPENEELRAGKRRFKGVARLHDPATAAFVIAPELFTYRKYYGDVECKGEIMTGYTFFDLEDYYGKSEEEKNVYLVETIKRDEMISMFLDSIRSYHTNS